jgi:serine/threonine protein kinase
VYDETTPLAKLLKEEKYQEISTLRSDACKFDNNNPLSLNLWNLIISMLQVDPAKRPSAKDTKHQLLKLLAC